MDRERGGFALVASLIAVVLLGALIVGMFVSTSEETRIAAGVELGARALTAAESEAEAAVGGWGTAQCDSVAPGSRLERTRGTDGFLVTTTLVRLNQSVYWLVADAAAPAQGALAPDHRRVGLLLRRTIDSAGHPALLRFEERAWSELF